MWHMHQGPRRSANGSIGGLYQLISFRLLPWLPKFVWWPANILVLKTFCTSLCFVEIPVNFWFLSLVTHWCYFLSLSIISRWRPSTYLIRFFWYQRWVELESGEKECSDKGSASVNFTQKWQVEMSFRGILLTFILHFRACTFLLLLE